MSFIDQLKRVPPKVEPCRRLPGNEVTITFRLEEDVTPELFMLRVAEACATYGALRPGEAVVKGSMELRVVEQE